MFALPTGPTLGTLMTPTIFNPVNQESFISCIGVGKRLNSAGPLEALDLPSWDNGHLFCSQRMPGSTHPPLRPSDFTYKTQFSVK